MTALRGGRRAREVEYNQTLRITAVTAVITAVVVLAFVSFRFSYAGVRSIVVAAGVSPGEATVYPLILDGMLVIACVAGLALYRAEWWMRGYAWLLVLILLAVMATLDALHAAGIGIPHRLAAAVMALIPWALLLLGLGLFLGVLRDLRKSHAYNPSDRDGSPNGLATANSIGEHQARAPGKPDVSLLIPGFKRPEPTLEAGFAGPAESGDPDEPAVRLLPPGPKPGTASAAPGDQTVK